MPELLDLNEIAMGKVDLETFKKKLEEFDLTPYEGKHVRIRGCAPVWAHLMVAGKLFGKVKELEFLLDDGKEGVPIEIYRKRSRK